LNIASDVFYKIVTNQKHLTVILKLFSVTLKYRFIFFYLQLCDQKLKVELN